MNLRSLLGGEHVLVAEAALQKHLPLLFLTPTLREGKALYQVSGRTNLAGDGNRVMQLVARDGIEPPTPAFSGPRSTN